MERDMQGGRHEGPRSDHGPAGRRSGRQFKILLDGYNREAETGHLLA
jgi:hypothetical protein